VLGLRGFHDLQAHAMRRRILDGLGPGIALSDKGHLDRVTRDVLHPRRHLYHLCALLLMGGGHMQSQQMAQGIDRRVDLATSLAFRTVITDSWITLRRGLPRAATEGCAMRLSANRSTTRKSCTICRKLMGI
jgi:hypothetical protein